MRISSSSAVSPSKSNEMSSDIDILWLWLLSCGWLCSGLRVLSSTWSLSETVAEALGSFFEGGRGSTNKQDGGHQLSQQSTKKKKKKREQKEKKEKGRFREEDKKSQNR